MTYFGFPWNLQIGDEVYWNDPDESCSKQLKINDIKYHGELGDSDCIICITEPDGSYLECLAEELNV